MKHIKSRFLYIVQTTSGFKKESGLDWFLDFGIRSLHVVGF